MTSVDKLQRAVEIVRGLPTDKLHVLDRATAITVMDHVTYHDWQARAQAHGLISADVATWLYNNLGPVWMPANDGWPIGVDTATKFVVTHAIGKVALALQLRGLVAA